MYNTSCDFQTTLRNMMGVRSLYGILTERDQITLAMQVGYLYID